MSDGAEKPLLFIASKPVLSAEDTRLLRELARKELFDWEQLFSLARRHNVYPRVWNNISRLIPEVLPEETQEAQKDLFRRHTLRCLAITGQLCAVSHFFSENAIRHIPIKGPILATYLFGNHAMRSYCDLDILIDAAEFPRVYELLTRNGYSPEVVIPERQLKSYASVEDNLSFLPKQGVPIEVHWELSGRYLAKPMGLGLVSQRLSTITVGQDFPLFSVEDQLVYLCLHGSKHCWEQLDLVACLAELLGKKTEVDWTLVFKIADEYVCRRMIHVGLFVAREIYNAPLPDAVWAQIKNDRRAQLLGRKLAALLEELCGFPLLGNVGGRDPRFSLFRLQVRDSPFDAARYVVRMFFIPSKSEWKAFRLPDWFVAGYWLARPFRIFGSTVVGALAGKWRVFNNTDGN